FDYATVAFNRNGKHLWTARMDSGGEDESNAIVVDHAGDIYITGFLGRRLEDTFEYATVKYSKTGKQLWLAKYRPEFGVGRAEALQIDKQGSVYVTGSTEDERGTGRIAI